MRVSARNNCSSCLSFGPSPALHPPAHIPICAGECAWVTNQNPAPYCAIISCRDPERPSRWISWSILPAASRIIKYPWGWSGEILSGSPLVVRTSSGRLSWFRSAAVISEPSIKARPWRMSRRHEKKGVLFVQGIGHIASSFHAVFKTSAGWAHFWASAYR
jgi:hypothetical protein